MALRKIIEAEGKSFIQTPMGAIENGVQKISFLAYVKVTNVVGSKTNLTASVHFKSDDTQFSKQYSFAPSVENGSANFIEQTYNYLKTLPEFAGSEDC
jgi:hypothetical protein